ncbi:transglutaminaseTgpA domain-containing protein [Oryzobacter telluris]|uniref:transglutaminaseTgpA domain-containing protein n=1 Tax=Oryzobacter telluris TaxID=3149179 RepID=UPI00370DBC5D
MSGQEAPGFATALRGGAPRRARGRRDPDAPSLLRRALPTRDALVDAGFATALVVIALVGLRTGFLGAQWIVAAGVGLVLGLVIGHLATAWRWMAVTTLLVLALVYFVLGGPVAVRDNLIGGVLPTVQTFRDLAEWSVLGWKRWLTLLPPVDARGPVLALPWLAGLLGGSLTLAVARRWASVPLTAVVPVALLAGSIALGTSEPAAVLVQGVGFALVLVGWLVVRAHRSRPPVQNGAGRNARLATGGGLLALALVAGLLAAPLLPGSEADARREVVRTALVPPLDVSQFPSPLPGFRRYTEPNPAELYDKPVLQVTGLPAGAAVRFATLDAYDGLVWGAADRSTDGVPFQQVGSRIGARGDGRQVDVEVEVVDGGYGGPWLPTVGAPTSIEFEGPRADELSSEVWLNTDTETAVVPGQLVGGERYRMTAILPPSPAKELPKDLQVAGDASTPRDTDVLDARIDAWTSRAEGAWGKFRAVATQMHNDGTYTDGGTPNSFEKVYLPGHAVARLGRFVNSTKLAGNDEQYAATLALVGQRLGIPTRVVMGAEVPADGTVRGRDVHAWVEVQESNGSWFPISASTFVPSRDKTPSEQQLLSEEQKVGAQVPPPAGVNPPSLLQGPDQAQNATDLAKRKKSPFDIAAWPLWLKILVFAVLLPLLLAAAYVALVRWLKARRRRTHTSTGPLPARAAWLWRDLVAEARSLGVAVPRRVTRREQALALDAALLAPVDDAPGPAEAPASDEVAVESPRSPFPTWDVPGRSSTTAPSGVVHASAYRPAEGDSPSAARVATSADGLVFGPGEGSEDACAAAVSGAAEVRAALRERTGRWVRLRSDADPRPLLARRERSRTEQATGRRRLRLPSLRRRGGADPTPA